MPQLMPLLWMFSSLMVLLLFMVMLDFFNYKLIEVISSKSMLSVKMDNMKFKW